MAGCFPNYRADTTWFQWVPLPIAKLCLHNFSCTHGPFIPRACLYSFLFQMAVILGLNRLRMYRSTRFHMKLESVVLANMRHAYYDDVFAGQGSFIDIDQKTFGTDYRSDFLPCCGGK